MVAGTHGSLNKAGSTKMTQISTTAGIDTSRAKLDIAVHGGVEHWQVENTSVGWRRLAVGLSQAGVTRVGIEASGGYERGVVGYLRDKGLTVLVLQPIQVKAYARVHLRRAKNDKLDAVLIAACAATIDQPRIAPDERLAKLAAPNLRRTDRGGYRPLQDPARAYRQSTAAAHGSGRHRSTEDSTLRRAVAHRHGIARP
jgi:hypothetical protein